jgi:O-antigen ligase
MTWFVTGVRRLPIPSLLVGDLLADTGWGPRLARRASAPFLVSAIALAAVVGTLVPAFGIYMLVGLLGLVAAVASYLRPPVGLFLFAFVMYGRVSENLTFTFGVPSVAPLLAVFLLTGLVARESIGTLWKTRFVYWMPLIVYGIVQLVSVFVATNQATVIDMVIIYVKEMVFIAAVVLYVRKQADLRIFTWALILAGVAASVITIYQNMSGTDFQFFGFGQSSAQIVVPGELEAVPRPSGYVGDPNFFALSLLPLIPLAAFRARHEMQALWRVIAWLSIAALATAIVMTYSRGAYLALAVVVAGLVWCGFVRARTLLAGAIVLLLLLPVMPASYSGRFTSMVNATTSILGSDTPEAHGTKDSSVDSRVGEVTSGLHMFLDHPILGVGLHNYPEHFQEYVRPLGTKWRIPRSPHSLYVEIAAETGLMGLASFGALVVCLFWWLRGVWLASSASPELRDMARALAVGLAAYLVASIFLHASYPRFLWMLVAGVFAAHSLMWEREHRRTVARLESVRAVRPLTAVQRQRVRLVVGGMAVALVAFLAVAQMNASLSQHGAPLLPQAARAEMSYVPQSADSTTMAAPAATQPADPTEQTAIGSTLSTQQLTAASAPAAARVGCQFDAETSHNVCGAMLEYVTSHGGLDIFGHPLMESVMKDGTQMQYFQNALLEVAGDGASATVQTARLGEMALTSATGSALGPPVDPIRESGCVFEDQTRQNVCGAFAFFWLSHGGVEVIGLPISAELTEGDVRVQYFENMRLEMPVDADTDSDAVRFSPLGERDLDARLGEEQ